MLEIKNLHARVDETLILSGLSLTVRPGEIHAIMGPNGAGKSTLAKVLAGHPAYEIVEGTALLDGEELTLMEPEERARKGLFMSFQYPLEIFGLTNAHFLYAAHSAKLKYEGRPVVSEEEFEQEVLLPKARALNIKADFLYRAVNDGFSGGEKKRNEILQMAVLDPRYAILDETDSGLDIDALRAVAKGVKALMNKQKGLVLITHYQRLLDYIRPDYVHVMKEGKIVKSAGYELALQLEAKGYELGEK